MSISNITLSAGVRSNLLNLQTTANDKNLTQTRLSTGKKVNTALDNPSNFFTASSLTSRANDLSNLLDGMANGIQTIQAANNGLTSITTTLQSMQSTLNQARQDKSFQTQSYTLDTATIGTASAKTLTLSGGSIGTTGVQIALNTVGGGGTPAHQAAFSSSVNYAAPSTGGSPAVPASTEGTTYSADAFQSGDSLTIDGHAVSFDGTTDGTTPTAGSSYTETEAIAKINHDLTAAGSNIQATDDAGKIKLTNSGASQTTNFTVAATTTQKGGFAASTTTTNGTAAVLPSYSFSINGHAISLTNATSGAQSGDTLAHAVASINSQLGTAGVTNVTASVDGTHIKLQGAADGSNNVAVTGTDASALFGGTTSDNGTAAVPGSGTVKSVDDLVTAINATATGLTGKVLASNDNGKLRIQNLSTTDLTVTGVTSGAADGSASTGTVAGNSVRTSLAKQFNDLRDQLTKFGDDASFNGTNLLRGDNMKLTLNETGTSFINVQSQNAQGNAASIDNTFFGIDNQTASNFDQDSNIDTQLGVISNALSSIRSVSSSLGSQLSSVENRQSFTKSMINTLQTGSDNLTLADTNEEGANLLALNTRQQLETTSLSFASQADQAVLSFLR